MGAAYSVQLTYFQKLPALSASNTSNWLLAAAPDVYLDGALAGFHEWDKDFAAADRYRAKVDAGLLRAGDHMPPAKLRVDAGLQRPRIFNIITDI